MKYWLKNDEIRALLVAVTKGYLDTDEFPGLIKELQGVNAFEELMKTLPDNPE